MVCTRPYTKHIKWQEYCKNSSLVCLICKSATRTSAKQRVCRKSMITHRNHHRRLDSIAHVTKIIIHACEMRLNSIVHSHRLIYYNVCSYILNCYLKYKILFGRIITTMKSIFLVVLHKQNRYYNFNYILVNSKNPTQRV